MEKESQSKGSEHSVENFRLAFIIMAILAYSGLTYSYLQTSPNRFPDLATRFRIDKDLDPDGIYRLSVYRRDGHPINWWEDDLTALERKITTDCGSLSKFTGTPNSEGYTPVDFRIDQSNPPLPDCGYLRNT